MNGGGRRVRQREEKGPRHNMHTYHCSTMDVLIICCKLTLIKVDEKTIEERTKDVFIKETH